MIKGTELASVIPHLRCNKDEDISISGSGLHIDKFGMELLPNDVKKEGYFPASVLGDGNCLPRSANHTELRARIALELACYLPLYVDHIYLRKGEQLSDKEALVLPKSYVMYSELYTPGDIVTSSLIERTLFEEIRKVCSANEFMGIWQLFALASVLGRPLQSVYPNRRNPNVRKDLNRSILPREMESNTPAYILWSSNRNDEMTYAHWIPNHFCPNLKMSINDDVLEYSTDTLGDIDLENISGLSEQLAPWVMDLLDDSDSEVSNNQYNMDETTADQHSLLDKLTDNQSSMTVKPKDVQPFASVQPDEALMSNLQVNSEQSNNSIVVSKDETTADQHSLLDELTDNQSSMTVKPMDVQPFPSVQPEVALMANLQDKSEQRDKSIVLFQEKPLYDQLLVSEHYTKRCKEQQRLMCGPMFISTPTRRRTCG